MLRHPPRVVHVVERAAAPSNLLRHALVPSQTPLVPELHRQPNDVVPLGAQHGRDGGGIHTARHSYRNGASIRHDLSLILYCPDSCYAIFRKIRLEHLRADVKKPEREWLLTTSLLGPKANATER